MDHFKRTAFYQEFPFLQLINRPPANCEDISIRRITLDLLYREPRSCKIVGPGINIVEGDEVILLADCGSLLGQVWAAYEWRSRKPANNSRGRRSWPLLTGWTLLTNSTLFYGYGTAIRSATIKVARPGK